MPVGWYLNENGSDDIAFTELQSLFETSFSTWTSVPCAVLTTTYLGTTAAMMKNDTEHVMSFVESGWVLDDMTLGATSTGFSGDPLRRHADITFNGETITWKVGGGGNDLTTVDPQSVFTHEIGHFLGLGHTRDDGSATMAAAYLPDLSQRTLSHDDKWGICTRYPDTSSPGECDPAASPADCPEGSTCEQLGDWYFCVEERDGLEEPCNVDSINCQDTCIYTSIDLSTGFCSKVCNEDADCPENGVCEPLGAVDVCRLPDEPPADTTESTDVAAPSDAADATDTKMGFEIGIVESPEDDVGRSDEDVGAMDAPTTGDALDASDTADPPLVDGGDDEGCGCRVTTEPSDSKTAGVLLMALCLVALVRRQTRTRAR